MKKLFLICLLILGTQLAFAIPGICSTNINNKNTVNLDINVFLKDQFEGSKMDIDRDNYSTGNANKDTVNLEGVCADGFIFGQWYDQEGNDYSTGKKCKDTRDLYCPNISACNDFICGERYFPTSNDDTLDVLKIKFSTDYTNKDTIDFFSNVTISGRINDCYDEEYSELSTEEKNAIAERKIKEFLLTTPGDTEEDNNVSLIQKAKDICKEKFINLWK